MKSCSWESRWEKTWMLWHYGILLENVSSLYSNQVRKSFVKCAFWNIRLVCRWNNRWATFACGWHSELQPRLFSWISSNKTQRTKWLVEGGIIPHAHYTPFIAHACSRHDNHMRCLPQLSRWYTAFIVEYTSWTTRDAVITQYTNTGRVSLPYQLIVCRTETF